MPNKYFFTKQLYNSYLGITKEIKAQSQWELNLKEAEQLRKWQEQETRQREKERVTDLKSQSESLNAEAEIEIKIYKELLSASLKVNDALNWGKMMKHASFRSFTYTKKEPTIEEFFSKHGVPNKSFLEKIFKSRLKNRLAKEEAAQLEFEQSLQQYKDSKESALSEYEVEKASFEKVQKEHNDSIGLWKEQFESGDSLAIEKYISVVLANSKYPDGISSDPDVFYDIISKTAVISFNLPTPDDIPDVTGYKYVTSRKAIDPITIKPKEKASLYEGIIQQITLRTIHELFEGVYIKTNLENVVFNGWVSGVNKATGKDFTACIISVQASRKEFEEINLERVDVRECLRGLKALTAGPLQNLAPVKPIMDLNREDKRFVSSVDVLDSISDDTNLATMPWEAFEHLVRELFGKIFSKDGAEVRVTQASRDGGVDAIAFDPDPIRGGKFVIQAKRYNNVVPVSACRDLYGTMINEGAVKGILVTTSYYGSDSREFVKDKPITLIDGSNLVYMLGEYGYDFRIALKEQ